jgi:stage V sporulation protein R
MTYDIDELKKWDEKILELVARFKLNCYPQEYEICDHNDMLGYMAYSGMPSRYSHWSFGKSFERQKTLYNYGAAGLPYEMVINSNPCLAYLMRDNTLLLQILTMAHVYGHNDFFANNFTFTSGTQAEYTLEMFKNNAKRINDYIEDPSIGIDLVEDVIDSAHALSMQRNTNLAIKKLTQEEAQKVAWEAAQPEPDPYQDIHVKRSFTAPELSRVPLEPDPDILLFIAEHNKNLPEWKRDILRIVDQEMQYFIPQIETKIMNEGWASYWHHRILNQLNLEQGLHLEFLVRHNQVLCPHPGGLNPYHLGFVLWHDIEKRWNEKHGIYDPDPFEWTPGREKIFEIRQSDRDSAFLRRFLSAEMMRELDLFQHEKKGTDRVITKISDEENWEAVKHTLIANIGSGSIPKMKIIDSDYGKSRSLYLRHEHDGRDLLLEYAEQCLKHIAKLWERDVYLETTLNSKPSLIKMHNKEMTVETINP